MEKLLSLNYGQIILYGYLCNSIDARSNYGELDTETLVKVLNLVIELTEVTKYETIDDCPDVLIMKTPENSYQIFCDWYDENETYFVSL